MSTIAPIMPLGSFSFSVRSNIAPMNLPSNSCGCVNKTTSWFPARTNHICYRLRMQCQTIAQVALKISCMRPGRSKSGVSRVTPWGRRSLPLGASLARKTQGAQSAHKRSLAAHCRPMPLFTSKSPVELFGITRVPPSDKGPPRAGNSIALARDSAGEAYLLYFDLV